MIDMDKCGTECETYSMTFDKCFYESEIRADERRKLIKWLADCVGFDCFHCLINDDCALIDTPCYELLLAEYEKERKNEY